jgi:thiamine biosynthesis lipoprotein
MKQTRLMMGMPISVEILDLGVTPEIIDKVFASFDSVDRRFSTYRWDSEISRFNRGEISRAEFSPDMREVFVLSEKTKRQTDGYFDIYHQGLWDPSGLVKGWAIYKASQLVHGWGFQDFYVDAGGDIQAFGHNAAGHEWRVGIRNPFRQDQIVKVIHLSGAGIATSGTYVRGNHIYDPHSSGPLGDDLVSLTVIGPNVYEADRFATAAFAMGRKGISFIEGLKGFEGYAIDKAGLATFTSGFEAWVIQEHHDTNRGVARAGHPAWHFSPNRS